MITITNVNRFNNTLELCALSTDVKPTETFEFENVKYRIRNGSTLYEQDTTTAFMYDEENHQWLEQ